MTETDELIGVFRVLSALPQYLIHAMFVGAETVTVVSVTFGIFNRTN